ncbi:MAG: hypothetical protein IPO07_18320 [Haliscomenobacter sp.]|nr:hypothetical protein [Haliscomenobacter sp.]
MTKVMFLLKVSDDIILHFMDAGMDMISVLEVGTDLFSDAIPALIHHQFTSHFMGKKTVGKLF